MFNNFLKFFFCMLEIAELVYARRIFQNKIRPIIAKISRAKIVAKYLILLDLAFSYRLRQKF